MTHPGQGLGPGVQANVSWWISSYSDNVGGSCVEAGSLPDATGRVAVRHSHYPDGLALVVGQRAWGAFVNSVKNHELG